MKSVNVSFDYDGKHYKFNAKLAYNDGRPQLTKHKVNEQVLITYENGEYSLYDYNSDIEVMVDSNLNEIRNVILWTDVHSDAAPLAMLGEFDNCKTEIKGVL